MAARKLRPAPIKRTKRGPKTDAAKKALAEEYFAAQREAAK